MWSTSVMQTRRGHRQVVNLGSHHCHLLANFCYFLFDCPSTTITFCNTKHYCLLKERYQKHGVCQRPVYKVLSLGGWMGQDHHIECTSLLCLRSETLVSVQKWAQDYWYKQMSESVCLYQEKSNLPRPPLFSVFRSKM